MTKALVTGGAGFIGSELVRQLAAEEIDVVVLDDLSNGRQENLEGATGRIELVVGDVRDRLRVHELVSGADVVFHLACLGVRHSIHSPVENHEVNASATLTLLEAAREAGVARFVHVSSSEVYGTARHVPMSEQHPTYPSTVYGASKLAGECYARAYHDTYSLPAVVVRPFNAYGPRCHHEGDSGEVIPKFLLRCLAGRPMVIFGDGSQTRDFTHVSDAARGIRLAGFAEGVVGATLNLGSGEEISINHLADAVADVVGVSREVAHEEPRPGDVLRLCSDVSRAKALLRFEPTVSLRDGLADLRAWYAAEGVAPEVLLEAERVRNWEAS